jgi:hypothetical protein
MFCHWQTASRSWRAENDFHRAPRGAIVPSGETAWLLYQCTRLRTTMAVVGTWG